jgi:Sec-independent protein translocase protein TatA
MSGYHLNWEGIGWNEIFIVLIVIFILFGNRLPGIMRTLGRGPWL